jgi:hypothetical protein
VEVEKYAEEQRSGSGLKDKVVYESESFFIKRVIPALIFLLFCLAVIFSLVLLKENHKKL